MSDKVEELKAYLRSDIPGAVWEGKQDDYQFGGLFLHHLTSARKKQAAALKSRRTENALQIEFGEPRPDKAWWYTTDRSGERTVTAGQEIVAFGEVDRETHAYPKAWIAFIRPSDGGPLHLSPIRVRRCANHQGHRILDLLGRELVMSSFLVPVRVRPPPCFSRVACASFLLCPTAAAAMPVLAGDGFQQHGVQ